MPNPEPGSPPPRPAPPELSPRSTDPAQESLTGALRSSFAVLRLVMIVLVVLYLVSGVFTISPGEQGVIVRLGKLKINEDPDSPYYETPVFGEGWIVAWPDPFDEKIRIPGKTFELETDAFLFQRTEEDIKNKTDLSQLRGPGRTLKPGRDGAMLTGDKNLSHGLWRVEYRIHDAAAFVQRVGEQPADLEPLLKRLFEQAILREVAYRKVEEVTRGQIDVIAGDVARRLQHTLDELELGVEVVKVNAQTIVPPQVASAFNDVTRAENEKKRQEDAALQKATEILNQAAGPGYRQLLDLIQRYGAAQLAEAPPERLEALRREIDEALDRAQGEVAATLREAVAAANEERETLGREYEEFTYWLEQYRQYPRQTLVKLWTRVQDEVLGSKKNEVFWVPDSQVIEILVNRDPLKAIEAERERLKKEIEESSR